MLLLASHPIAAISAGMENLLTPSPREVFAAGAPGAVTIDLDLGEARAVDTIFLGFTNAGAESAWRIDTAQGMGTGLCFVANPVFRRPEDRGAYAHGFLHLPAPVAARYFRIRVEEPGVALQAGVLMLGAAIVEPHELGGGRAPIDTGAKEALEDGGFGLGDGIVKSTLRWRFVGLDDDRADAIYDLAFDRGERRPVLAVDSRTANPADATGRNDRIHYGLFDRFEAYERRDPADTAWALSMTEWA